MADLFPDEGLDWMLKYIPGTGANPVACPSSLYLFLWGGTGSASTCPPSTALLGTQSNVTESVYSGYTRVVHNATGWSAAGAETIWGVAARRVTGTQVSFPAVTTTGYGSAINGFGIATGSATGAGSIAIYYSNFDDTTAIASLNVGDVVKVTPKFGFSG